MNIHSPQMRILQRLLRGVLMLGILALLVLAVPGVQAGVDSEITQSPAPQQSKWPQPPDLTLTGFHAHDLPVPLRIADDWQCQGGDITDLHWWGYYDDSSGPIAGFDISIYNDVGGAPDWGNGPIWGLSAPMGYVAGEVREVPYDTNSLLDDLVYYYEIELVPPVLQVPGQIYWLALMALSANPQEAVVWHWQSSATMNLAPPWQWDDTGYQVHLEHDMAFEITEDPNPPREFGEAPEGENAIAYPATGVTGAFPTCKSLGPAGWIQHDNYGAYFGQSLDMETDGNAGVCPGCFPTYDDDECFMDIDSGLRIPEPFTIDSTVNVVPCVNFTGTPLGSTCQTAVWGTDVDIEVHNTMPNDTIGYVNVLMDWNQDGVWGGSSSCPGATAPEHVLVNYQIPNPYDGPLSAILPPPSSFLTGPNHDYVWTRFTITERPVTLPWTGEGVFEDGETEDYLLWIEEEEIEHKMHFPQYPDPNGWDVNAMFPKILADDFLCTATGSITNVVFWGSWQDDQIGEIVNVHLSFHEDDRTGSFSKPGALLWEWNTNIFEMEEVEPLSLQGWYDPNTGEWLHPDHEHYFRFDVPIPEEIAFVQEQDNIYWLDLQFIAEGGTFGVKTSLDHFEDDAVWGDTLEPAWQELIDPQTGESLDLAFVIQGEDTKLDFGDAPDPTYPTLRASDGARHPIQAGFHLGASIDPEPDGQPDASATGDDNDGNNDEDGVIFKTGLLPGQQACMDVTLTNTVGFSNPSLDAWIDFDANGNWDISIEHLWFGVSQPLVPGSNSLCFNMPNDASRGPTYARFRLSDGGFPSPIGIGPYGEVEDYHVFIEATKWEQPPTLNDESPWPECFWGWDEISDWNVGPIVADDWMCKDDRPVTDIHWWGSYVGWAEDVPPPDAPLQFHIGVWTDIPAGATDPWSHPGEMFWEWIVSRDALEERVVGCDFYPTMPVPDTCFAYDFKISPQLWFTQDPGQHVYWLSISAKYEQEPAFAWGWKTREHNWNDAAVRIFAPTMPGPGATYIAGERIENGEGLWDMAFILTTLPGPPEAPDVDIDIVNTDDVELSWQHVTQDIFGNSVTVVKYYIYRDPAPYQGAAATLVDTVPATSGLNSWIDPTMIGDPTTNYYYYVQAVALDKYGNDVLSAFSNHVGEFDFALVKGSP